MQWNIHKTKGTDGVCNADRTANWMVKLGASVISLNEVSYFSGDCSYTADQGATLEALLEKKTGKTWYRKSVNMSKISDVILSRYPFASTANHWLSYDRGIVQVGIVVNGRNVNVFSTHVDYYNATYRTIQTNQVKSWVANFAAPRIIMGDFNTWPGTLDYNIMASAYGDGWMEAKQIGTAWSFNGTGATHGTSRFDYAYQTKVSQIELKSVTVPNTCVNGVCASDHDPVISVYAIH
jgi:endonuclease/exonuclease/phosphatase family metal-dependent hydrolase